MKAIKCLWHGVDTAKVGYLVQWPNDFERVLRQFEGLREKAQILSGHGFSVRASLGNDPNELFIVRPMGARMMPFAFEGRGMVIFVGNTMAPWRSKRAVTPNVRIEFQPFSVAVNGLPAVHAYALKLIEQMGGYCEGSRLSEIHLTSDMETDRPHQAADYHTSLEGLWKRVRTRIRSNGQEHEVAVCDHGMVTAGSKLKQVNIGKDKKMLRIYDKLLELRVHPDKFFEAMNWNSPVLLAYLCDRTTDKPPETAVMRVEFQMRRERLLELNVSTVEDFLAMQGGLWRHLTHEFVALINDDDTNRTRCTAQEWWKAVQNSWDEHPPCELSKRKKAIPDVIKYVDQSMGLLLAMGARLGNVDGIELKDILDVIETRWEATHPESWREIMQEKFEKLQILWAEMDAAKPEGVTGEDQHAP